MKLRNSCPRLNTGQEPKEGDIRFIKPHYPFTSREIPLSRSEVDFLVKNWAELTWETREVYVP